jgi:hypothetical protein
MYPDIQQNKNGAPTIRLRGSVRSGDKVTKVTYCDISDMCKPQRDLILMLLETKKVPPPDILSQLCDIEGIELQHGLACGTLTVMSRLDFEELLGPDGSMHRRVAEGLVAARVMDPLSKRSTVIDVFQNTTLGVELGIRDCKIHQTYRSMDWLLKQQERIERKLCRRYIKPGCTLFVDASSSYYVGMHCMQFGRDGVDRGKGSSLVRYGYSRDRKMGFPQVNYAVVTDDEGRPLSISVYPGNTSDTVMFKNIVKKFKDQYNVKNFIMVGDRGMISGKDIHEFTILNAESIKEGNEEAYAWITALKHASILKLMVKDGIYIPSLMEERNLVEIESSLYPGERLMVCRNPFLMEKRRNQRDSMIAETQGFLEQIKARIESGTLKKANAIAAAIFRVINKRNMAKHFTVNWADGYLAYSLKTEKIEQEKALDGIYVVRSSVSKDKLTEAQCVLMYKNLSMVERAFRAMKTTDLCVRPIFVRLDDRIRAHLFIVMLAYYVSWHMRKAWAPLTFADTELFLKDTRDPVDPARRSELALKKASSGKVDEFTDAMSFASLKKRLATWTSVYYPPQDNEKCPGGFHFPRKMNPEHKKLMDMLKSIPKIKRRR